MDINVLLGKTIAKIEGAEQGSEVITFHCADGLSYVMFHEQDCLEIVSVEDICGDVNRLIGYPIIKAEGVVNEGESDDWGTSTWTFYHLATVKGYVTIRWLGESNGYYSESVTFTRANYCEYDSNGIPQYVKRDRRYAVD